jgi:hypothetical protein
MPFDPTKPANGSALSAAEMRNQLTSLKTEIDAKAATSQLNSAIGGTAQNPNGNFGNFDPNWEPTGDTTADFYWLRDRIAELYSALAR